MPPSGVDEANLSSASPMGASQAPKVQNEIAQGAVSLRRTQPWVPGPKIHPALKGRHHVSGLRRGDLPIPPFQGLAFFGARDPGRRTPRLALPWAISFRAIGAGWHQGTEPFDLAGDAAGAYSLRH